MDEQLLREDMVAILKCMNSSGINQGSSGNLSARLFDGMLLTPTAISYEEIVPSDLLKLDLNGNPFSSIANQAEKEVRVRSSEWQLHADLLLNRPEINVVLHCHSIHATALACHGRGIPSFHYMTAIAGGRNIRCAPYATYGTAELSKHAIKSLDN